MTEPVAYLVSQEPLSSVRWLSDVKPIGVDDKQITPLYTAEQLHPRVKMTKAEFDELEKSLINAQFDYSELKKTIEIVPDMKWFVRSKEKNGDKYLYLKEPDGFVTPWYTVLEDIARQFDTKEEAEKWTNPLTEAVQLPVEGE